MGRGSDKHGPRIDDEMEKESQPVERSGEESHVDSARTKEGIQGEETPPESETED